MSIQLLLMDATDTVEELREKHHENNFRKHGDKGKDPAIID